MVDESHARGWKLTRDGGVERAAKRFLDGTHRTCAPEETLERIRPLFPAAGITRVADVSGLDRVPISTMIAHRPNSRTLAAGSGKGFTKIAATVSATMEAIEMYHAEFPEFDSTWASYDDLAATDPIVDVGDLPLTRHSIFATDRPERWVQGWDLVHQTAYWVPADCVDFGYWGDPLAWRRVSFQVGSNGLASGNARIEATLAGLYEVVERDAVTSWHVATSAGAGSPPTVDLSTIVDPLPLDLIGRLASVDVRLVLYDCTIDTNVPTYRATIYDETRDLGVYSGYGAHLDPAIAMIRAITEAVQGRVVYVAGSRDDLFDHRRFMVNQARATHMIEQQLHPAEPAPTVDAARWSSDATDTFEGDLGVVVDRLGACGCDRVVVMDLTQEAFGVPVVRVLVPGLEGYPFPFYRPGHRAHAFVASLVAAPEPVAAR